MLWLRNIKVEEQRTPLSSSFLSIKLVDMLLREESQGTMQFVVVINDYHQHFIISSISTRGIPRTLSRAWSCWSWAKEAVLRRDTYVGGLVSNLQVVELFVCVAKNISI